MPSWHLAWSLKTWEIKIHRLIEQFRLGSTSGGHLAQTLPKPGPIDQVAQALFQLSLECLQRWSWFHFHESIPATDHCHGKTEEVLKSVSLASCSITVTLWEAWPHVLYAFRSGSCWPQQGLACSVQGITEWFGWEGAVKDDLISLLWADISLGQAAHSPVQPDSEHIHTFSEHPVSYHPHSERFLLYIWSPGSTSVLLKLKLLLLVLHCRLW